MAELTEADRYLLERLARGDADGWRQLVERYQGRLAGLCAQPGSAARKRLRTWSRTPSSAFLEGLKNFRENASVETFLFTILRRKLIDFLSAASRCASASSQEALAKASDGHQRFRP
jgi:DNA-directed RNA polymerase specialized sigma24 family protein